MSLEEKEALASALRVAIASGTQSVTYDGKTVVYRSLAEMRSTLRELEGKPKKNRRRSTLSFRSKYD